MHISITTVTSNRCKNVCYMGVPIDWNQYIKWYIISLLPLFSLIGAFSLLTDLWWHPAGDFCTVDISGQRGNCSCHRRVSLGKHRSQCTGGPFSSTVSSHDCEFHLIYLVFAQAVQPGKRRSSDSRRVSRQCTIQFFLLIFFSTNWGSVCVSPK